MTSKRNKPQPKFVKESESMEQALYELLIENGRLKSRIKFLEWQLRATLKFIDNPSKNPEKRNWWRNDI